MRRIYVSAAELHGRFSSHPDEPLDGMMIRAAKRALESAGLRATDVDAIYAGAMGNFAGEGFIGPIPIRLANALGCRNASVTPMLVGSSEAGAWALNLAYNAMRHRHGYSRVLVVAGEQMNPLRTDRPSGDGASQRAAVLAERTERNRAISEILDATERSYGLNMMRAGDLIMDIVAHRDGWTRKQLRETLLPLVALRKYERVRQYPMGHLHGEVEPLLEIYESRPPITGYFNLHDVTPTSSGAVALVLSVVPGDRALELVGMGRSLLPISLADRRGDLGRGHTIQRAYARACDDAGVDLQWLRSCDFAVVHDAFPSIEYSFLSALGFGPAEVVDRLTSGWSNPFGGLKTCGHALGASGLLQIAKAHHRIFQDTNYVPAPAEDSVGSERCFCTSVGGPLTHVVISLLRRHREEHPQLSSVRVDQFGALDQRLLAEEDAFEVELQELLPGTGRVIGRTQLRKTAGFGDEGLPLFSACERPWVLLVARPSAASNESPKCFAFACQEVAMGAIVSLEPRRLGGIDFLEASSLEPPLEKAPSVDAQVLSRCREALAAFA